MTLVQAAILGVIQGLSEFLPISSSGHLLLSKHYLAIQNVPIAFDIMVHCSTLVVVCIFFRKKLWGMAKELMSFPHTNWRESNAFYLLMATIITGITALSLRPLLYTNLNILAFAFLVTAFAIATTYWTNRHTHHLTLVRSLVIGLVQGLAVLPGLSRAGLTIAVALALGLHREEAAEFSFILSIPVTAGAVLLSIPDIAAFRMSALLVGMLTAFVSGYISLRFLIVLLRKGRLYYFVPYVIVLAILSILSQ